MKLKIKENNKYQLIKTKSPIFSSYRTDKKIETEALFGETFYVKKILGSWVYGELLNDGYIGWLKCSALGVSPEPNFKISVPKSFIYKTASSKSLILQDLSLSSLIHVKDINKDWVEIIFNNYSDNNIGFIPKNHITPIIIMNKDWVSVAESLIQTPYKWGGKSSAGIDCSGLVQISINSQNIYFPRNSSEQFKIGKTIINFQNTIKNELYIFNKYIALVQRGDLLFWPGHVAIALNNKNIIHANGFHMTTKKERFINANKRFISKEHNLLTIKRPLN